VQAVASRQAALSGTPARVDYVVDGRPPPSRRDPRPAPDVPVFPFAALGLPDTTVRGFYTPGLRVPLVLDGDASLRPGGASALVRYSYAAGLDPRLSAMEVRLDGVAIKSVSLDDPAGETGATVRVALPDALVSPSSNLEIGFSLFPADYDACVYASDATLWATIHADSTLTLPRDGVADLPDLGLLRHGLWPFHLGKDGGVVAALPDRPGASDVGAGFQLAAALGRWSTADAPRFQLRAADGLDFAGLAWGSGDNLLAQVAYAALLRSVYDPDAGEPTALPILRAHGWLLSAGSVLTLIVEIGAPLALFHRYLGWSWALATLAMHQGIALLMGISFPYQTFGLAFLCFLPVERLLPAAWRPRE
jgi:hypothetical protein